MDSRLEMLLKMKEEDPCDSFVLFALAKEYEKLDDDDNALMYYLELNKNDETYVGVYYHLGKLYERLENFEAALATYKNGVEIANSVKDYHSKAEIQNALINLEMEL